MVNTKPRPFLKWVGGKRQILNELRKYVPEKWNTYYEPFLGGGAFFFDLIPQNAILGDINPELILVYRTVQNSVEKLVKELKNYPYEKRYYYNIRDANTNRWGDIRKTARFIYLNKSCYNGLYRVNKDGKFNVPFGRYKNPLICDEENLKLASSALKNARIICGDFCKTVRSAKANDFVYFDPPYEPISKSSNFVSYHRTGFGH